MNHEYRDVCKHAYHMPELEDVLYDQSASG